MTYNVIRCLKCGTPQYIRKTQKIRICPRCHFRIQCNRTKTFATAETEDEASAIVRSLKTPGEIEERIAVLKAHLSSSGSTSKTEYKLLGEMITELLATFPKIMPESELLKRATQLSIGKKFVLDTLAKLNQDGSVLINKDGRGNTILQFPKLPIFMGKLTIKKPISTVEFRKKKFPIKPKKKKEIKEIKE